jgi:myosin heavy subunit
VLRLKSINDSDEFAALKQALTTLNFDPIDQTCLLDAAAALLHLGQVRGMRGMGNTISHTITHYHTLIHLYTLTIIHYHYHKHKPIGEFHISG